MDNRADVDYDKARLRASEYLEAHGRKRWTVDEKDALADAFVKAVAQTGGQWSKWKAPAANQNLMHDTAIIEGLQLRDMTGQQIANRIGITLEFANGILHRMRRDGAISTAGRCGRYTIYTLS